MLNSQVIGVSPKFEYPANTSSLIIGHYRPAIVMDGFFDFALEWGVGGCGVKNVTEKMQQASGETVPFVRQFLRATLSS